MKLSEKITTFEEYLKCELPPGNGTVRDYATVIRNGAQLNGWHPVWTHTVVAVASLAATPLRKLTQAAVNTYDRVNWWLHRESARQHMGVYQPATTVLAELQTSPSFSQYFPHISREDDSLIAFTPTQQDGVNDRQVKMALGRFLRKYSNTLNDNDIAYLEARHRSEMHPDIRVHSFLDDWETCLGIYKGINSCMSKSEANYTSDVHPVAMYKAPGWHLATMYNAEGKASSRCVVWINPKDPEDKRWVRVYGDTVLQTWLGKNGFKAKSFEGAYLYTHVLPNQGEVQPNSSYRILMGYLDTGTNRSEADSNSGIGIWDGANKVYLLPRKYSQTKYPNIVGLQSTSGHATAVMTPIDIESAITGERFNGLEVDFVTVFVKNMMGFAKKTEAKGWPMVYIKNGAMAYVPPDTPTFEEKKVIWLDTAELRKANGYDKLVPEYYPDEQDWVKANSVGYVYSKKGLLKRDDAVYYIASAAEKYMQHASDLPKDAERVSSIDDYRTFAHPKCQIVRTTANRKVVPGVHDVVELYNGEWLYTRHARQVLHFGTNVWIPKDADTRVLDGMGLPKPIKESIERNVSSLKRNDDVVRKTLYTHMMNRGDVHVPLAQDGNEFSWSYVWQPSEILVGVVRKFLAAESPKSIGATAAAVSNFKHIAGLLIAEIDEQWAAKTAAQTQPAEAA